MQFRQAHESQGDLLPQRLLLRRGLLPLPLRRRRRSNTARRHLHGRANHRLVIAIVALLGLLVDFGDTCAPEQIEKRGAFVCGLGDATSDEAPADEERGEQFEVGDAGEC